MTPKTLQKIGGLSAIFEALIYIVAFIIYGGVLVYPSENDTAIEKLEFLSENLLVLSVLNFVSLVLFGILLAILVLSIYQRQKKQDSILPKLATIFGIIWVSLVIASGMIANIGLHAVTEIGVNDPEKAMVIWSSVNIITEGLGGGNEIVGGIWVLILSFAGLKTQCFPKTLNYLGLLVGLAGVLTIYPLDLFTEIFGLSQIIWFLWIGIFMIRTASTFTKTHKMS